MSVKSLRGFGEIDLEHIEECYEGELTFNNQVVSLDINSEQETVDEDAIVIIEEYLVNFEQQVDDVYQSLRADFDSEGEVYGYIAHHLDEDIMEADEKQALGVDLGADEKAQMEAMYDAIVPKHLAFYPDDEENMAVFDFSLKDDMTNYLLAVYIDKSSEVKEIFMES